jgi:DNA-directed RNA polymerase subunit omega
VIEMKLIEGFDSNYRYVLVAARRARQLQSGSKPLVEQPSSRKACRIAEQEIQAGKVQWVVGEASKSNAAAAASAMLDRALGNGNGS